jgi:hypothetical protein
MNSDDLAWLQNWYLQRCNGEWEHGQGIKLSTLDNPGWRLTINLRETNLEGRAFPRVKIERTENVSITCWVQGEMFQGAGGPLNLAEMIGIFRRWAEA